MEPNESLYTTPEMMAIWSSEAHVKAMLSFEAALARAQARANVIPRSAAAAIDAACRSAEIDVSSLYADTSLTGTPVIPLVRMLSQAVEPEVRSYVHFGATSQDAIDTATMLQARDALDLLITRLLAVGAACAKLAEEHYRTPMAGRTIMQQAAPISFGLKAARWIGMVTRQARRLYVLRKNLVVQFGGAVGTLASLDRDGPIVTDYLAEELGLGVPDLPWHAERDRIAELASALGIVAGSMAKIASDVLLLAQTEVAEVSEADVPGKGGSSAMPHKRNPVDAMLAMAAARLATGTVPTLLALMAHEHERSAGAWQAEWAALPGTFRYTAGAVERVHSIVSALVVNADAMRANLDMHNGLIMAEALTMEMAKSIGRSAAFALVQAVSQRAQESGRTLHDAALDDEVIQAALSPEDMDRVLDPANYLGSAEVFIDRAIAGLIELRVAVSDR